MVLQQVQVEGFTEAGLSGVTALAFDSQTRNSLVGQIGWRTSIDLDDFQPFMEMNWNHEYADKTRSITTSLTSVGAPSYVMDAVPAVADWATMSLGSYYRLSPQMTLRGAASSMFINPQMVTCGGEVGLNVCF